MAVCGLLIAVVLFGTGVHSCSPNPNWEPKTLEVRARQPQWVVYGTVLTDEMPAPGDVGDQESVYTLRPECWLKHDYLWANVTFANITVLERKWDCVAATPQKGNKYIIFLRYDDKSGPFIVDDVNVESGVIDEPTPQDFWAVYRGIKAGKDGFPDGMCTKGVDIPCFVGDITEECSHGVVVKAAMLSVVMTSLFAKLFF